MSIQNFPEEFITNNSKTELYLHDYKMTNDVIKSKVNFNQNAFSFLQKGSKRVHFFDRSIDINNQQSILIKKGNCLVTELLDQDQIYNCKLFFFSSNAVTTFLEKYKFNISRTNQQDAPFFVIENDDYINIFVHSISEIMCRNGEINQVLLQVKFDELMLYLIDKYGQSYIKFILSINENFPNSNFRKIVETNLYSNLKLEEIAFLCNMSLSNFKRNFILEFKASPGKYFQQQRLQKAKELLRIGKLSTSEVYSEVGYQNHSNFSVAFKNEFGISPSKFK